MTVRFIVITTAAAAGDSYDDRRLTLCLALHTTLVDLVGSVAETAQTTSCLLMGTRLLMGTVTCGWGGGGGGCCPL